MRGALVKALTAVAGSAFVLAAGAASGSGAGDASALLQDDGAPALASSSLPSGVRKLADLAYGASTRQRVDVYLPPSGTSRAGGAPILVMVHGGAWMFGDKGARGVVAAKVEHWVATGWILVSVNNRLFPEAEPLEQAQDVASAVAFVQAQAAGWGGDPKRLVLMGHSAGAHLVALLSASPALAARSGAARWAGTVVLDSAAIDLDTLMQHRHARFYDRVFGADPAKWRAESPTDQVSADAVPMLLVCSSTRADDSCGQSARFAERVKAVGASSQLHREALSHAAINAELGRPGAYTDAVDAFIAQVLRMA